MSGEAATQQPASCPHCGSEHAVRAGRRKLKSGVERQLYRCGNCHRRYSSDNRAGKHTDPEAILRALALACRGYRYPEILHALQAEFRLKRSKAAVSRWIADYPLPWLEARKDGRVLAACTGPPVMARLFTHADLNYLYRLHLHKLSLAGAAPTLASFLRKLPSFIDHTIFDHALHCSQARLVRNPGLRHCQDIGITRMAAAGLTLAPSNRKRHSTLETYFLECDRNTVATEVPVWFYDKRLGTIAGHIDMLQIWRDRVTILDYKPGAAAEKPDKVCTQLTLYAHALSLRARIPLSSIQCGWFDEKDAWFFDPVPLAASTQSMPAAAPPAEQPAAAASGGFTLWQADRVAGRDRTAVFRKKSLKTYKKNNPTQHHGI